MSTTETTMTGATYDAAAPAVVIAGLTVTHPVVTSEAQRWSTGARGAAMAAGAMDGADLTAFVEQALAVGAQAISVAGGTQDTYNLEQLVRDVGQRTTEASERAGQHTTQAAQDAGKAVQEASQTAKAALKEAADQARKDFGLNVDAANAQLREQIGHLFGGEDPELVARLRLVVQETATRLTEQTDEQTRKVFDRATQALNPDEPTSPMARHIAKMTQQHTLLATSLKEQHAALKDEVARLTTAVQVDKAAAQAARATALFTPLKGFDFEEAAGTVLRDIASGVGDEYVDTGATDGLLSRNKKGDGVLVVSGGPARLVVEMHDSGQRRDWGAYLEEAERNRGAGAALGLVPSVEQNSGQTVRVIGGRRVVLAFDPATDDPSLLRATVLLLRTAALSATARSGDESAQAATERITEALQLLPQVDGIRKTAEGIRKGATKIDTEAESLQTRLMRLLGQAQVALQSVPAVTTPGPAV